MYIIIQYILSCHNHASCTGSHELKSQCLKKVPISLKQGTLADVEKFDWARGTTAHSRKQFLTLCLHRDQDLRWIIYTMKTQTFWLQTGLEFCEHILLLLPTCQIFGVNNFQPQCLQTALIVSTFFFFSFLECWLLLPFKWTSNFVNKKIKIANSKCNSDAYFCWRYSSEGP